MGKKRTALKDERKGKHSMDGARSNTNKTGAGSSQRTAATVRRLKMYKERAVRDHKGKLIRQSLQSSETPTTRIQPDRRWFGNTRVVGQRQLERFREEMSTHLSDGHTVLLRQKKLPLSLLQDAAPEGGAGKGLEGGPGGAARRADLLAMEPFADVFGAGARRKRPKLNFGGAGAGGGSAESLDEVIARAEDGNRDYDDRGGTDAHDLATGRSAWDLAERRANRDRMFDKGQSRRIWAELYKVLDSSDVVVQVLDARDPEGTRSRFLERHLRKNAAHKHLVLVLNKCDLVPAWVVRRWLHHLSREYPTRVSCWRRGWGEQADLTPPDRCPSLVSSKPEHQCNTHLPPPFPPFSLAFHSSLTNPFGKAALLSVLRQFARLRSDKPAISVGFVGYPNVGKSSVINTLKAKAVCKAAPVPGETKVWQYITLMKRVFLIDCPGVVYNRTADTDAEAVLKGVVRVENLECADDYVADVLARVKPQYLRRAYGVEAWEDSEDFLSQLARKQGRLTKGGDPDLCTVAKGVLYDWQRGRIPFFSLPPGHEDATAADELPALPEGPSGRNSKGAVGPRGKTNDDDHAAGCPASDDDGDDGDDAPGGADEAKAEILGGERAGLAAGAINRALRAASSKQARGRLPGKVGFFDDEDAGGGGSEDEADALDSDDEGDDVGGDGDDGSEAGARAAALARAESRAARGGADVPSKALGDEDDDESDSDGAGGNLSWEELMRGMAGGEAGADALLSAGNQANKPTKRRARADADPDDAGAPKRGLGVKREGLPAKKPYRKHGGRGNAGSAEAAVSGHGRRGGGRRDSSRSSPPVAPRGVAAKGLGPKKNRPVFER